MTRSKRKRYPPAVDVSQLRRKLVWLMPLLLGLLWGCWWLAEVAVFPEIEAFRERAATVDVTHAILFFSFFALLLSFILVLLTLQAIPCDRWLTGLVELAFVWFLLACIPLMLVLVPAMYLLPNRYMPELGYTMCKISPDKWGRGGPGFWVKNPNWCVKGKTREWVNEQARQIQPVP
jgi:hypothetical protein